jgi:hypothetical protein
LRTQYEHAGFFLCYIAIIWTMHGNIVFRSSIQSDLATCTVLTGVEKFIAGLGGVKKMMADNTT